MIPGIAGRRALVTAAGRGIGRAIALTLAREGALVAVFSRTQGEIESLLDAMGGAAMGHYGRPFDFEKEGAAKTITAELSEKFGAIDIAVHNLGGTLDITDALCSVADWRRVWRLNIEIAIELNLQLVPPMRERQWGRIVHIASTASLENNGPVPYCTAKAALAAYTHSFGRVLAADGIVMSAVMPGVVLTDGGHWEKAMRERPEHVERYLAERCPSGRFGTPEEIDNMTAFLCSDWASFCQGALIPVDGGQIRGFAV